MFQKLQMKKKNPLTSALWCVCVSVCVCSVREAVCVFGDRGLLRPGQTLVEHTDDGLCYSRQCSRILDPTSGFHLLRTSTVNCSAHCQPVRPTFVHNIRKKKTCPLNFVFSTVLQLNHRMGCSL